MRKSQPSCRVSLRDELPFLAHRSSPGVGNAYNPFSRVRSRETTQNDAEAAPHRSLSEAQTQLGDEHDRALESAQAEKEFGGPHHASTEPSPTSGRNSLGGHPTATTDFAPSGSAAPQKVSADISSDKTAVTNGAETQTNGSVAKHRGWVKSIVHGHKREDSEVDEGRHESEKLDMEERKRRALKKSIPVGQQIRYVVFGAWINVLLVMVPVGFGVYYTHKINDIGVFLINFIAIIPLAAMLSNATEELAIRVGETLGGLLNASFGNAVELIVSVQALIKDEITIVKTSLIGSILSNLLLVLGMSFFAGGFNRVEQFFNITVAQTAASILALSIASLIIPTVFHNMIADIGTGEPGDAESDAKKNSELSHGTAIILLFVYGCYLFFQLKTHATMYSEPSEKGVKRKQSVEGSVARGIATIGAGTAATSGGAANQERHLQNSKQAADDDEDDFEEPNLTMWGALITLAISTTLVAFCSEFMVSSIDGFTRQAHISTTFVGLILLPIVGNAAEHATAVTVAIKDKMDLSIGVAVGSSMQIALLVLPGIVVIGWIAGKEDMTLYFDTFQIAILFVAVLLVNYLIGDGKSHWLEGVLLMSSYVIISLAAWFYPDLPEGVERR
ncbi:calcium/proton exchanger [Karstenula rhodostoma CBS 690.94]|uniref:Calcium/proton exchanger n=1 Tax=Karstenula rhodostoma CBS 690.94 TaxID=1392251 RepID=A0A9P4UIZ8_9PLEO|nr:calcium/proton exchanger [Karstenula rhodostoma CBS 690.94]